MPAPLTYLLVDGHSVIHAWPELKREHRIASRRHLARTELLKRLRNLQDMSGMQVVVVFDGADRRCGNDAFAPYAALRPPRLALSHRADGDGLGRAARAGGGVLQCGRLRFPRGGHAARSRSGPGHPARA